MGWTLGIEWLLVMGLFGKSQVSISSLGTLGWDGHLGLSGWTIRQNPKCPYPLLVHWDGMDTWD